MTASENSMAAGRVTMSAGYERPPDQPESSTTWKHALGIVGLLAMGVVLGGLGMHAWDTLRVSDFWLGGDVAASEGVSVETGGRSDSGVAACGAEGSFDWQVLSAADIVSMGAVRKGLSLLEAERTECAGGKLPAFPFEASDFEQGQNHSHFVHIQHKFASTCKGQTFKLHYFLGGGDYSFVVEVHHSLAAQTWQILRSRPAACDIQEDVPAGPEILPPSGKLAQDSAGFVLSELSYRMQKQRCLGHEEKLQLGRVKQIKTSVDAGLLTEMILEVDHVFPDGKSDEKVVQASILQVCDAVRGSCLNELVLPKGVPDVCAMLQKPSDLPVRRLYAMIGKLGHVEPDATELMVARSEPRPLRQLKSQTPRPALMLRHIKSDNPIPSEWHPDDDCAHLPVLDQGMCGSCYAHAFAAMVGERKCRIDKASRRLASESCQDSLNWTDFRFWSCKDYAKHDPGCKFPLDLGQRTHCKKTCNTCPTEESFQKMENQWADAEFEYLPAVAEVAPCSETHDGQMSGCGGGNIATVWNYWLRQKPSLKLWRMGAKCRPYVFKCWESKGGVVNPRNMGHCGLYDGYQLFQKPCSCIPHAKRPTEMKCEDSQPPPACAAATPFAVFTIMNKANGLSTEDTVKNMQRHIVEFGPIYASFATTSAFMDWNWDEKPVYTGGGSNVGGHAVVLTGWGTQPKTKTDYWRFKNSWGPEYAKGGYGKFQRGVNLDQIEEREMAAAMPSEDFDDFSAPECNLHQWSTSYWKAGDRLTQYKIYYHIKCNKDAEVSVFASHRIQKRSDIYKGVAGSQEKVDVKGNIMAKVPFNLVHGKFGLEAGDQWIKIHATDAHGNKHANTHFVSIPKVPGVQSYAS